MFTKRKERKAAEAAAAAAAAEAQRRAAEAHRRERERQQAVATLTNEIRDDVDKAVMRVTLYNEQVKALMQILGNDGEFHADSELVEPRKQEAVNLKSFGFVVPARMEQTVIDTGEFCVYSDRAVFSGKTQNRSWDFAKVIGFNTDDTDTLLINVSNRQKVSGVCYSTSMDVAFDFGFRLAFGRFQRSDTSWAFQEITDFHQQAETYREVARTAVERKIAELRSLGGDVQGLISSLPELPVVVDLAAVGGTAG